MAATKCVAGVGLLSSYLFLAELNAPHALCSAFYPAAFKNIGALEHMEGGLAAGFMTSQQEVAWPLFLSAI
jgi:hypothetical protein